MTISRKPPTTPGVGSGRRKSSPSVISTVRNKATIVVTIITVTNAAITLSGRVACNLNYTVTNDVLNACIRKAGIRHVLTSKKVMEKLDLKIDAKLILLEDFKEIGDKNRGEQKNDVPLSENRNFSGRSKRSIGVQCVQQIGCNCF